MLERMVDGVSGRVWGSLPKPLTQAVSGVLQGALSGLRQLNRSDASQGSGSNLAADLPLARSSSEEEIVEVIEEIGEVTGTKGASDLSEFSHCCSKKLIAQVALVAAAILAVVAILAVSVFLSIGISLGLAALGATGAVGVIAIVATKIPLMLGCGVAVLAVMAGAAKGLDMIDCHPAFQSKV